MKRGIFWRAWNRMPFQFRLGLAAAFAFALLLGLWSYDPPYSKSPPAPTNYSVNVNGARLDMIWIPAGSFLMGSPDSETGRRPVEGPRHKVTLDGFWLGKFEVTEGQYEALMGKHHRRYKASRWFNFITGGRANDLMPAGSISWFDAIEFCVKLSAMTGDTYTLPTEAQWEYACRAGTTTPFHFGATLSTDLANCYSDTPHGNGRRGHYRETTTMVGSYPANAWGLHDMHGNVEEWCADFYADDYYKQSPERNPLGPGSGWARVTRGASLNTPPLELRSAARWPKVPINEGYTGGFRVARLR